VSWLDLSESDGDSSDTSILQVCVRLDGFDGDAYMSDVEGVQDDMQVVRQGGSMTLLPFGGARQPGAV